MASRFRRSGLLARVGSLRLRTRGMPVRGAACFVLQSGCRRSAVFSGSLRGSGSCPAPWPVARTREGPFGWLSAVVGVSSSAGTASCASPGLACAGGATCRIGDCLGASGFGDGIRKMHSKMKYSGKAA
jgi:hypothetical protein